MPFLKTLNPGYRVLLHKLVVRRATSCIALAALAATLSGCQGIVSSTKASQVRIIDASPDAPGLDIYQNNAAVAYNLGFGTITSYVPIDPGPYITTANAAGTKQVLSSSKATFTASSQYTVLIGNVSASLQQLTLKDQSQPAPSGQIALRFIDQATRISAVDVYLVPAGSKLTDVTPVTTGLVFNTNTGYLNIPAGTYTLVMVPNGTVPTSTTIATYTGAQVTYTQGSATTIILIDQQLVTTPGLQVLSATDFLSPTATN
ncbi:DUF4397 domain-containing protein [Edaphobacter bradus]|uniref:DUF4397 domain-containing protein n=1 Tax=Edaphobacter bradus TaxID=2259016 RepID=UPI0021DFB069|nr:DUF4397 domain-containing protein [Edaphobacter bradus]